MEKNEIFESVIRELTEVAIEKRKETMDNRELQIYAEVKALSAQAREIVKSLPEDQQKILTDYFEKTNLIADYDLERWLKIFDKWQRDHGVRMVKNLLAEMFPARLAEQLSFITGNENYIAARFPAAARRKLAMHLTALPLNIKSAEPWDKAMITRGGVALKSVDAVTLESRIVPGLHFAGEVLDLDGPCGGYNLQWAFSSGYLAGNLSNNLPA